jgi:nitrate reductase gamma subunit
MGIAFSFAAIIALIVLAFIGVKGLNLHFLIGVIVPYAAFLTFTIGFVYKVVQWGRSPVPFRIPTTGGQGYSFPWIKQNKLDSPPTTLWVIGRMLLEVLVFRSLFRNTKAELKSGKLVHGSEKYLWLFGLIFHWSFLIVLIRHFRFFMVNVPDAIKIMEALDAFFQVGVPLVYLTDLTLLVGVTFLFIRRVFMPQIRFISLPADYFPLLLIFSIAATGILMRYFLRVDIVGVKQVAMGLVSLHPIAPASVGVIFYIHLFLVSMLFAYFPFSKLMHLGGVFMSPTRNLANNSRMVRHINPWNYPVHVHTYEQYEDEFRDKMKKAGLPVEKE